MRVLRRISERALAPVRRIIDGVERRFDWVHVIDERDALYPVSAVLTGAAPESRRWISGPVLDQGSEGACVGFGWAHEFLAHPVPVPWVDGDVARRVYRTAQKHDPWPGEAYEGSSVGGGAKAAQIMGFAGQYRHARTANELARAISQIGPAVIGVRWYEGMTQTDPRGFIRPTGKVIAGHCVMIDEWVIGDAGGYFGGPNSWGNRWGVEGRFRIHFSHMDHLFSADFEAIVPIERYSPARPAPEPKPEPPRCPWWRFWR